jgi:hypothetical protein
MLTSEKHSNSLEHLPRWLASMHAGRARVTRAAGARRLGELGADRGGPDRSLRQEAVGSCPVDVPHNQSLGCPCRHSDQPLAQPIRQKWGWLKGSGSSVSRLRPCIPIPWHVTKIKRSWFLRGCHKILDLPIPQLT